MPRVIASTGLRFRRFLPYVPAIGDDGAVLFHATLRDGTTAIVEARDGEAVLHRAGVALVSHPVAWGGGVLAYGADGRLWMGREQLHPRDLPGPVGPLGPTVANGVAAVRLSIDGVDGVARVRPDGVDVFPFPAEHVTGLPVVTDDGAVWARTTAGDRWRIWRDGVLVHEDDAPSGAFLAPCGDGVLLPYQDRAHRWPGDEAVPTPFPVRGVAWAGSLVCFQTAPAPLLQIGSRVVHRALFALNAASVSAGRVVATVPTSEGRELVLAWDVPIGHAAAPEAS